MEKIIGNTIEQRNQLSFKEHLAYAAGSNVVYYSYKTNNQSFMRTNKCINAILISIDGNHLFTGEQSFKNPAVNVFRLGDSQCYQLCGHKLGIHQLLESPCQPYLFSLGTEQDRNLILWNWKEKKKLAQNKLSKQVYSIQYNPKGTLLVSAGEGHLKYWQFAGDGKALCDENTLQPKSFTLQEQFALKTYVDCVVKDRLYTITQDGLMCLFSLSTKSMIQWINLNVENVFSLAQNDQYVICSGSSSIIRIFNNQLQHLVTLPKPSLSNQKIDCIAIQVHNKLLASVYKNRMMILWDISEITSIMKVQVIASHCNSITNLQILNSQSSVDITFFVTITEQQQLGIWHTNNQIQGLKSDCQNTIIIKDLKQTESPSGEIQSLNVSNDGKYLALGDQLGFLRIMSLIDFEIISVIKAHSSKINCIKFSESFPIVVSGSDDQTIMLFDDKFNPIINLKGHKASIINILFVKDIIISCSADKQIIYWKQHNFVYKQFSQLIVLNFIKQIETDGENLFVIQDKLITVFEVNSQKCKYTLEIDNCVRLIFKNFIQNQMLILVQKNNVKIIKHENGQLNEIEDFSNQNIQALDVTADNKQLIMVGQNGCIYFQKLKWQPQVLFPKLIDLFKNSENSNKMKWIINNLWNETKLRATLGLDDDDIGIITFESDDEKPETQTNLKLNIFNDVIETLGITLAQEIQSQFQNNMNQVLKSYKEQSVIKSTLKENEDLLRNPFYEEQQNMQEFHRRQNSNILKKMQLKKSDQQEVKAEIQQNSEIAIPFQSQISKKKLPEFPKLQQIEFKSIVSSTISKSPCNRFKQKFDYPYQNSIILNCSYLPSERKDSVENEIDSQYQQQQINLAKCHTRLLIMELNEMMENLSKLKSEQQELILNDLDKDLNDLDQEISEIRQIDTKSILLDEPYEQIQKIVKECNEQMFQSYIGKTHIE